jgi:hypothetical protein
MKGNIYISNIYMNDSWPTMMTMNSSMLPPGKPSPEVDVDSLLKGRKFGTKKEDVPFDMCPPAPQYGREEMLDLEEYCKKRGIVGVNFSGMNPHQILSMLKGKAEGKYTPPTKRGILHG